MAAVAILQALALLIAAPAPDAATPVPIQRPENLQPLPEAPSPAPEPAPQPEPEPAPAADPAPSVTAPAVVPGPPEPTATDRAEIEGWLVDRELAGAPITGAGVELSCTCLPGKLFTTSDEEGHFAFADLPAGVYTVVADRGGPATQRTVALARGQRADVELRVAPPTPTVEIDRRHREEARARTMLGIGGVAAVGAVILLLSAGVERAKHDCQFGLEDCARGPRPGVTMGLGIAGGLLAVGGGTLIGVGAHRLRKLRASIAVQDGTLALRVAGRF
jgi:hypothetical protein